MLTGCSSGIGRDAAIKLSERGWRVFATCRKAADCTSFEANGIESFPLDHADTESIATGVREALGRTDGNLDALVVNGAHALPCATEDVPRDALREIFEVNLFGPFDLINRVIPAMRAQGHGRIVNVSSVLGIVAATFRGPYSGTKFAMEGMTDSLRRELTGTGIHLSLLQPGPITTRIRQNAVPHFERWIDWETSALRDDYETKLIPRLYAQKEKPDRFELPPSSCTSKIIHALESPRPRARYRVTTPTYLAEALRRLLPTRIADRIVAGW
ncbi:SDR family NAD(P)-dependent oxidoreductase [Amaricoccus macauensis]|uniref:SDR family NAD(P)-dependent oxidoreductase n=1 Tax=Amaricoccus macauensis TaxID=57001 RepID=UPI003C7ED5CB